MSKIEKRVVISCSLERLFTYVPEIEWSPEIWPGLLEERYEPLVDRDGSLATLGNVECAMKWSFQSNTRTPSLALSGDYTYWSMC